MLALGLASGRVMLADGATGEVKWDVQAYSLDSRVAMSPGNGRFVASVSPRDKHWKLWDSASGELHRVGAAHDGTGACICAVFDLLGQRVLHEGCPVVAHIGGIYAVALSSGQRLATGGSDGAVIMWDAQTGEAGQRMQTHSGITSTISFSADGARLASGNADASIRVWDVATGVLLRTIQDAHVNYVSVCFSPTDNRILASAGADSQIHLWDLDSGEMIRSIAGSRFAVFSPDGHTIASAIPGTRDVQLIDADSGALRFRMVGHEGVLFCASFSVDDGSKLASGSRDGTCKVWDSSTGALLRTINAGNLVGSLAWGRDWVRDEKCVAFAMGHHPRLGTGSRVLELEVGVVQMILDRA